MHLSRFPRLHFAHLPTPLEPLPRISKALGGPDIWIKRDDCTGLSSGGNKTRKLEFLMADALEQKADAIITQGATQSNHVRQTCAITAKLGLEIHVLLEDRTGYHDEAYAHSGNVLLDQLHGADISTRPAGSDMDAEMEQLADFVGAAAGDHVGAPAARAQRIGQLHQFGIHIAAGGPRREGRAV